MHTAKTDTQTYNYLILLLLVVFTILIRLPILFEPWGADQATFGTVAKGILDGKVPYKDMYSLTGYGIFFTFALFFKLFGLKMISPHLGHLLISVFTVILVFAFTNYLYGRKTAIIAGICYTIFSNGLAFSGFGYENKSAWGTYWYLSQREVFMAPLITAAVFLIMTIREKRGLLLCFLSGILIGLAAFYKLTAVLILFLFIIFWVGDDFFSAKAFSFRNVLIKTLGLLLGFILIQFPFIYYFWIHNALGDVYQALFVHVGLYAKLSRGYRIEALLSGHYSVLCENLILWLFALVSCLYILFRDRSRNNILIVLWTLCSLLMVWGQGKFFGYHFIILMPPFAILTGYGLNTFLDRGPGLKQFFINNMGDMKKAFMLVSIAVSLIAFAVSNYDYYRINLLYSLGKISTERYYNEFNEFPTHPYSFRSDYSITQFLKEYQQPGDRLGIIFSAGDCVIHFLSGLSPATRFVQSWYLFSSDPVLCKNEITLGLRKEFVSQLMNSAPRFILCVHIPFNKLVELPCVRKDPSVKKLAEFIRYNYKLKKIFPDNRSLFVRT